MGDILVCSHCRGPAPAACSVCPHCKTPKRRPRASRFGTRMKQFALGASASMTLTACYGAAPAPPVWNPTGGTGGTSGRVEFPTCDELAENLRTPDTDGDGYCAIFDCNENDPAINAAANDVPGDGIDQNCNGEDKAAPPDAGP